MNQIDPCSLSTNGRAGSGDGALQTADIQTMSHRRFLLPPLAVVQREQKLMQGRAL
jgi:hypothetical protein